MFKITQIRVSTFWMPGKSTHSRQRPMADHSDFRLAILICHSSLSSWGLWIAMYSAQQSGSSYPLAQGLHRDLVASTLFWSNPLGVGRFFCDVAAMRLRFGCDAKRESLCEIIDVMKTWCPLFVASCRARRRSTSLRWTLQVWGRQNRFEAGSHIAGHGGTFGGGHICMLRFRAELVTKCLQRRSRKGGCHRPVDFHKVLKEFCSRVHF